MAAISTRTESESTTAIASPIASSGEPAPTPTPAARPADFRRVWLIALGHGGADVYPSLVSPLLPLFYLAGRISLTEAGIVSVIMAVSGSILQPLFGYISDRTGGRWPVYLGPAWCAVCISLIGLAPNLAVFILLALFGGIGTAMFHPQSVAMVGAISGKSRALGMAIFQLGGNIGYAMGPVLVAYLSVIGVENTVQLMPIGLIVGALLFLGAPQPPQNAARAANAGSGPRYSLREAVLPNIRGLSLVVGVVALRTAVTSGLLIVFPLYLKNFGMEFGQAQLFSSVVLWAGSLGAMSGGWLADRFGYRLVMVTTLAATTPLLAAFAILHPVNVWLVFAALIGISLLASSSLAVVMAQELLPRSTGIASGMTLGFGFGLGGILSGTYSIVADHAGLDLAVALIVLTPLVAALTAALIPGRRSAEAAGA